MGYFYLPTRTFPAQQARTRPLGGLFLVSKPGLLLVSASALVAMEWEGLRILVQGLFYTSLSHALLPSQGGFERPNR